VKILRRDKGDRWVELADSQVEAVHKASSQMIDSNFAYRSVVVMENGTRIRGHVSLKED